MQIINLSTSPNVFISMPVEALIDAGIEPGDAFEIGVEDEKIIIQKAQSDDKCLCDGDCNTCPFREIDCDETNC